MSGLTSVGYFLFSVIFGVIIFTLWCRIALRFLRLSALHPLTQMIHRFSDPIVLPVATIIKAPQARKQRYDIAAFVTLVLIEMVQFVVLGFILSHALFPVSLILLYTCADLLLQPCHLLFYAVLIRILLSWLNPGWYNPLVELIYQTTEPLINYVRRYVPSIYGLDLSAWIILIVLKCIQLFISASLPLHLI